MPRTLSADKRQQWEERVRMQQESGQSMSHWCREQQINYDSFLYWKKRFSLTAEPLNRSSFQELLDPAGGAGVCIEYRGVRIILSKHFDPTTLAQCLQALKGASC